MLPSSVIKHALSVSSSTPFVVSLSAPVSSCSATAAAYSAAAHPSLRVRERCLPFESSRTLLTSVIFLLLYQVGAGWADEGIKKEGRRLIAMDKNREEGKSQWWFEAPKDFLGGDVARKCVLDNMHTIMP